MGDAMKRIILAALLLALPAHAAERSSKVRRQFQAAHPCPSTGAMKGSCPGMVLDHIVSLCWDPAGDVMENLQWQTVADGKRKDRFEVQACALRRASEKLKARAAACLAVPKN